MDYYDLFKRMREGQGIQPAPTQRGVPMPPQSGGFIAPNSPLFPQRPPSPNQAPNRPKIGAFDEAARLRGQQLPPERLELIRKMARQVMDRYGSDIQKKMPKSNPNQGLNRKINETLGSFKGVK